MIGRFKQMVFTSWILALASWACTSPTEDVARNRLQSLGFETTLKLRNSDANTTEVIKNLGEPKLKKDLGKEGQLWSYFDGADENTSAQRLGLLVDPKSGVYESAELGVSALMHYQTNKVFGIALNRIKPSGRPIAGDPAN